MANKTKLGTWEVVAVVVVIFGGTSHAVCS